MDTSVIEKKFSQMGARVKIAEPQANRFRDPAPFSIDVRKDEEGEFFDIKIKKEIDMMVMDVKKDDRHLLLNVKNPDNPKAKFLCGHDERAWFTCAIPETAGASTVFQAKQALKPKILRDIERNEGIKTDKAQKRHRKLKSGRKIHRQGEFMFIEDPTFKCSEKFPNIIHKNEPMSRSRGSKPHMAEFLYRSGGVAVMVSNFNSQTMNGITQAQYNDLIRKDPVAKNVAWQRRTADARVHVKGRISHTDHKTLELDGWYRVELSTEGESIAVGQVRFLD